MVSSRSQHWQETIRTMIHLACFAQLGVLTRIFFSKFFTLGCNGQWGPCLSGGIYFPDLPANMLGSFIIGVFVASSVAGLKNDKTIAILPENHSWQSNIAVQVGVRTGYCGSLTTFSSWISFVMAEAISSNAWMTAIVALVVGTYTSIVSYIVGIHLALYVDRWILKEQEDVFREEMEYRQAELNAWKQGASFLLSPNQMELERQESDVPRNVFARREVVNDGVITATTIPTTPTTATSSTREDGRAGPGATATVHEETEHPESTTARSSHHILSRNTDKLACIVLICMTIGAIIGTIFETNHNWLREAWLAVLFGPFGCFLRWKLASLNYRLQGNAVSWIPAGTFAANMLGTAISGGMLAAQTKNIGYWSMILTQSISLGFCGALSTVSTFVTEIVKFVDVFPDASHSYIYTFASIVGGAVVMIIVFGWAGWS